MERLGVDAEFARETLVLFAESTIKLLATIGSAIAICDHVAVRTLAHTLKGSALTVLAVAIAQRAERLEKALGYLLRRNAYRLLAASTTETIEGWR
jgi:HPt (histidine-containing phosphotransfer) domain-containing protein